MRRLTRTEETFLRECVRECNGGQPLVIGSDWCKSYRRQGGKHQNCHHWHTCLVWYRVSTKVRLGQDLNEEDFRVKDSLDLE